MGIAYLKMAADRAGLGPVDILSQRLASCLGDAALFDAILLRQPDTVGFVVYNWNLDRSLYLARRLKAVYNPRILFGGPEITLDNDEIRAIAEIQTFSGQQIVEALEETQEQFERYLSFFPDLDLSGCDTGFLQGNGNLVRTMGCLEGEAIAKLLIDKPETPMRLFEGPMQRQVLWWEEKHLPDRRDIEALEALDGIFIPDGYTDRVIDDWLTQWRPEADTLPRITFATPAAQKKWISLAMADDCQSDLLSSNAS